MLGIVLVAASVAPAAPVVSPDPRHLKVAPADMARAKVLVDKLGSPAYEERETAQVELVEMGRRAATALADGLAGHASPEVRSRCQTLYARARADDLQARLDTFAADAAGKFEHDIPGWPLFHATTAGTGAAARAVFVDVVSNPLGRELVLGDLPPAVLGARVAARKQELYTRRFAARRPNDPPAEPPVAEVVALMYAETRVPSQHLPRSSTGTTVFSFPSFVAALSAGGEQARVYRAVAGKWVSTRDEAMLMTQALSVATTLELPEAANLGARMLGTQGVTGISKAQAAMAVAKVGDPRHLPALESAFADETVVRNVGGVVVIGGPAPVRAGDIRVRDVALVAALLMTGQDPKEYGFDEVSGRRDTRYLYTAWQIPADKRAAAATQWREWRQANPNFGREQ
jgi:hypothetical protein